MTDAQVMRRKAIKQRLTISALLVVVALGLGYFRYSTEATYTAYKSDKAQESQLEQQLQTLENTNNTLLQTIEENGKQLVSFSEDKIKYINLASSLSLKHKVRINKLTVSDIWQEGEMSGMTTTIEIEGNYSDVKQFVDAYCSSEYTNRINVISCRPSGRFAWLQRDIDGETILSWFDLGADIELYNKYQEDLMYLARQRQEAGLDGEHLIDEPTYDDEKTPITLAKMFKEEPVKVYLVIDFIGRA